LAVAVLPQNRSHSRAASQWKPLHAATRRDRSGPKSPLPQRITGPAENAPNQVRATEPNETTTIETTTIAIELNRAPHRVVPAKTNKVRAAVAAAVADAAVAGVVAEKKDVIVRCRPRPMANTAQNRVPALGVCLQVQHITTASIGHRLPSRTNGSIVPVRHASQIALTTVASDRTQLAKVTAKERPLRPAAGGEVVEAAVAVVAVTAKERSAVSAQRPIATAVSSPDGPRKAHPAVPRVIPLEISKMSLCRPAMGFGSRPDQATPPDRMHPGPGTAMPLAPQKQTIVRRAVADAADAEGAKAAAAALVAPRHLPPKEAARAPRADVRAVPQRVAANAVAAATGGAVGRNAVPHRPLIAVVAMSSHRWLTDGKRTMRASSFSASRMPATMATPATSVTLPTMMTASSRAVSMTCLTSPAG
jgi:hypothetical protein